METKFKYRVVDWWGSGRSGMAKSQSAPNAIHFSAPPEFGGIEGRWTPEDLLLSAIASCFTATFQAIAKYSKFEYTDLQVEVEGTVKKTEQGYSFGEIVIRPTLTIPHQEKRDRAKQLLLKTQDACLVSKALAITPVLQPGVEVHTRRRWMESVGTS